MRFSDILLVLLSAVVKSGVLGLAASTPLGIFVLQKEADGWDVG